MHKNRKDKVAYHLTYNKTYDTGKDRSACTSTKYGKATHLSHFG